MFVGALPVELDFDAAKGVGVDGFAGGADDGGGLGAGGGGFGVRGVGVVGSERDAAALGVEGGVEGGAVRGGPQAVGELAGERVGQVVAGGELLAGNDEFALLGVVAGVGGVVVQAEPVAGVQAADDAAAVEGFGVAVVGLLAQAGVVGELVVVAGVVRAGGVVVGEAGLGKLAAALGDGAVVAGMGSGHGLVVVAGQLHAVGDELALAVPLGEAVFGFGGVGAVKAHALDGGGWQAVGVVESDEGAAVAMIVVVFKAPGQALLVQQAHDEVEVGFAVLQAVAAGGQRCGEGEGGAVVGGDDGVGRGVFVEDLADDGIDGQVLEHAAGAAMLQQGDGGRDVERVAGKAAVGAEGVGAGDDAATQQGGAVLLLQGEGGGQADEGGEGDGVVGGEAVELVVVGL